jgi:hypothetical protein
MCFTERTQGPLSIGLYRPEVGNTSCGEMVRNAVSAYLFRVIVCRLIPNLLLVRHRYLTVAADPHSGSGFDSLNWVPELDNFKGLSLMSSIQF